MNIRNLWERVKLVFSRWAAIPEYVYLVIATVSVIGFALITPPFQGPDEEAHYIRVQYIAHGYFLPVDVNSTSASLPKSIAQVLLTTFFDDDLRVSTTNKYETYRTLNALGVPLNEKAEYKPPMVSYSPLPYLPAVPGVVIANLLNLSPLISMYVARLSLGLASILLIFWAIRLIPHKKYLFTAVGLIPMLLFQQSVVTADSVSYALLALFIAFVLYLREKKDITPRQWLILGVICIGITLVKPLLYLFLPLVLLVGRKKFAVKWIAGIAVVCAIALVGWMLVSNVKSSTASISGKPASADSAAQLHNLIAHPKRGLRVGWNTYMTSFGDGEVRGIIGIFGAADTIYPLWMVIGYSSILILLASVSLEDKQAKKLGRRWKVLAAVLCAGYFVAVNLALYLGYSPVNFDIVYGLQGRYFLPMLIIAAAVLFIGGVRLAKPDINKMKIGVVIGMAVLVLLALLITYQRYYLYTP